MIASSRSPLTFLVHLSVLLLVALWTLPTAGLLISSLRDLQFGNATRLWDGLMFSIEAFKGVDGRRVVLLFTDGDDTASKARFSDVADRARDDEVMVYGIGLAVEFFNGVRQIRSRPDRNLRKIAEETGGGSFELQKSDLLASTFTRVAQELRSQYLLGFAPETLDGKVHKLDVRAKKPGVTVRARRSYLASAEATAALAPRPPMQFTGVIKPRH